MAAPTTTAVPAPPAPRAPETRRARRGRNAPVLSGAARFRRWWVPYLWAILPAEAVATFYGFPFFITVILSFTAATSLGGGGAFVELAYYLCAVFITDDYRALLVSRYLPDRADRSGLPPCSDQLPGLRRGDRAAAGAAAAAAGGAGSEIRPRDRRVPLAVLRPGDRVGRRGGAGLVVPAQGQRLDQRAAGVPRRGRRAGPLPHPALVAARQLDGGVRLEGPALLHDPVPLGARERG